ncbi:MAG: 50S ribosomal protein L25 [Bacteroidales bacterium]
MKAVSVSGSLRENVGKKDAKSLRKQGLVPCVLYGKGEQKHFSVDKRSFKNLIYTPETNYAEIDIDGTSYKAIVKDAQFHKVTDEILHVDFYEICDTKPIIVDIPLVTVGNSVGVLQGGRLVKHFRRIKVKGLYNKIPDNIEVDISHLKLHDGIVVSELEIEGVEVMENPATVVVGVLPTRQVEDTLLGDDEDEDGEETEGAEETATE